MLPLTKIKQKNLQIYLDHALLMYSSVCKMKCIQEDVSWLYIFFHNHNYLGGIGKFIYNVFELTLNLHQNRKLLCMLATLYVPSATPANWPC